MKIRIGLGSCGIAAGALKVKEVVEAEIQKRGLSIELKDTGCIGMCHAEPLLDLIDDQGRVFTYGYVTPEAVVKIFDEHITGQSPVEQY
ncbi:MAG: (2Fe-2S) ferredoxin domain-containing protein, partial [Thermacetogeniaceae bacterium]